MNKVRVWFNRFVYTSSEMIIDFGEVVEEATKSVIKVVFHPVTLITAGTLILSGYLNSDVQKKNT